MEYQGHDEDEYLRTESGQLTDERNPNFGKERRSEKPMEGYDLATRPGAYCNGGLALGKGGQVLAAYSVRDKDVQVEVTVDGIPVPTQYMENFLKQWQSRKKTMMS